jgi:hypothetical protein
VPAGLTGWFLDRDTYATGYLSLNELYDGLLQLPTGLTPHQILAFLTDLIDKNDRITLSRLWTAIKCPDLPKDVQSIPSMTFWHPSAVTGALKDGHPSSSLKELVPNLTQSQFEADILDISLTAAKQLSSISKRNKCLQQNIKQVVDLSSCTKQRASISSCKDQHQDSEAPWYLSFNMLDLSLQLETVRATLATRMQEKENALERLRQIHYEEKKERTAFFSPPERAGAGLTEPQDETPKTVVFEFSVNT